MIPWKLQRDAFYHDLVSITNPQVNALLTEAGYFEDSSLTNYDLNSSLNTLCTPFNFLNPISTTTTRPCVLVNTGSFCPVHQGHIETLVKAKAALELQGYSVLGGYLSPGHDEYIFSKVQDQPLPAFQRIALLNEALIDYPWLAVDPWESMFCEVAVNFTDVISRLERYLHQHFNSTVEVIFVCGGDNARFARTFQQRGKCVIVGRPGYEDRVEKYQFLANDRILFIPGDNSLSSTQIRSHSSYTLAPKNLHLRTNNSPAEQEVLQLLTDYFPHITLNQLAEQQEQFKQLPTNLISLDSEIRGTNNIHISRSYDFYGAKKLGYVNRPSSSSLIEQVANLDLTEAFLFDDDIHSGGTIRYVTQLLQGKVHINGYITLNTLKDAVEEVLDCRDFLLNNENNGLVCLLNGQSVRVPYIYPYVCPYIRASILSPVEFSQRVWELNKKLFGSFQLQDFPHLTVFTYLGFSDETTIATICDWHLKILELSSKTFGGKI